MKIRKPLAGLALVLALSGGGVVAASLAHADTSAPTAPAGQRHAADDAPGIGAVGQTGTKPPAGVTLEKGEAAVPAN